MRRLAWCTPSVLPTEGVSPENTLSPSVTARLVSIEDSYCERRVEAPSLFSSVRAESEADSFVDSRSLENAEFVHEPVSQAMSSSAIGLVCRVRLTLALY